MAAVQYSYYCVSAGQKHQMIPPPLYLTKTRVQFLLQMGLKEMLDSTLTPKQKQKKIWFKPEQQIITFTE